MVYSTAQGETWPGATAPSPHQHWGTEKAVLGRRSSGDWWFFPALILPQTQD